MTNDQWDDDKLEKLLYSMPKTEDKRSKDLVLERLKKDQRLKDSRRMNPKKWMPVFVAIAALLLLSMIVPSMISNNDSAMNEHDSSQSESAMDTSYENKTMEKAQTFDASSSEESAAISFNTVESHVLLAEELFGHIPFHIGLVESANVIPMTFLIPEPTIHSDFPEGNPSSIDLYNKYAAEIPEEELGFDKYHPYSGNFYEENGIIHHQIPAEHNYDLSSATVYSYINSMRETFPEYEKLQLVDGENNPTTFGSVGDSDAIELKRQYSYYKYEIPSGKVYLVPNESISTTKSVAEGLAAMKEANGDIFKTLIPENIDYEVREEDDKAVITFKEPLDVTTYNQDELNQMIEGFMLTAKVYGMQVQLENVVQESFGKYDLTNALPLPVGANPTFFTQ